ncbi:MAG: hypothetical protein H7833_08160 [Magnetococcus sp. DMHC-1]|nr:hypothetical protein [Magnetococcales bacterium]
MPGLGHILGQCLIRDAEQLLFGHQTEPKTLAAVSFRQIPETFMDTSLECPMVGLGHTLGQCLIREAEQLLFARHAESKALVDTNLEIILGWFGTNARTLIRHQVRAEVTWTGGNGQAKSATLADTNLDIHQGWFGMDSRTLTRHQAGAE